MALERQREPEPRLPQVGDVLGGKYRIEREIARGGMGAVFVASHEVTGGRVAIKCLITDPNNDAEATHRLLREARAAVRVRHTHVVDVYDVGEHEGSLFLVMELLEGETLSDLMKRRGPLEVSAALEILLPVMRGVQAAHRVNVIHRDLKPSNIFLCADEHGGEISPRVLDFGISKVVNAPGDPEHSLTQTGAVVGTPYYMAPEQLKDQPFDQRIDVYALGVILYQALSGKLPFHDANYNALVVLIATATPVPLSKQRKGLPSSLSDIVGRAMARAPEARYANVAELIQALTPFARRSGRPAPGLFDRIEKRTLAAAVAAFVVACATAFAWYALSSRAEAPGVAHGAPSERPENIVRPMPPKVSSVDAKAALPTPRVDPPPTPQPTAAIPTPVVAPAVTPTETVTVAVPVRAPSSSSARTPSRHHSAPTPLAPPAAPVIEKPSNGRKVVTISPDEF